MKTKNGIELNLKESEFTCEFQLFKFYFSSELYLKKFKERLDNYIALQEARNFLKYGFKLDLRVYLAFSLYKQIEKRRFLCKRYGYR